MSDHLSQSRSLGRATEACLLQRKAGGDELVGQIDDLHQEAAGARAGGAGGRGDQVVPAPAQVLLTPCGISCVHDEWCPSLITLLL